MCKRAYLALSLLVIVCAFAQSQANDLLFRSAESGSLDDVRAALLEGADIHAQDGDAGPTALMLAARSNADSRVITELLKAGADITETLGGAKMTCLMVAAQNNPHTDIIKVLLAAGMQVDAVDATGFTALNYAALSGSSPNIIAALLAAGAKISGAPRAAEPPLMSSLVNSNPSIAEALLKAGARFDAKKVAGSSTLLAAVSRSQSATVIRALIEAGADARGKWDDGSTALPLAAAVQEDPAVIDLLVKAGASVTERNADDWTALMICVAAYDAKPSTAQALVAAGVDVNATTKDGVTALMLAAATSVDPSIAEILVKAGAEIDARDKTGKSALMCAAEAGDTTWVEALLSAGTSAETQDYAGMSPLMYAAEKGGLDAVDTLLSAGAPIDTRDLQGATALMYAARAGVPEVVEALIQGGASVDERDRKGYTPLMWALGQNANGETLDAVLEAGAKIAVASVDGHTPLMVAAMIMDPDHAALDRLIDARAPLEARTADGQTALMIAAANDTPAVAPLLAAGARADVRDNSGRTALLLLAEHESTTDLTNANEPLYDNYIALLDAGVDPTVKDARGRSLLDFAATSKILPQILADHAKKSEAAARSAFEDILKTGTAAQVEAAIVQGADAKAGLNEGRLPLVVAAGANPHPEVLSSLVAHGADVNARDSSGVPALVAAVHSHEVLAKVKTLVALHADVNASDARHFTALLSAAMTGNVELAKLLLAAQANVDQPDENGITPLMYALGSNAAGVFQLLMDAHPNLEAKDRDGGTILMSAVYRAHTEIVKQLLEAGARVEQRDNAGRTALMKIFSLEGQAPLDVITLLLAAGANANDRDSTGRTALYWWISSTTPHIPALALLVDAGLDVEARDADGTTALMLAAQKDNPELITYLLSVGAAFTDKDKKGESALLIALKHEYSASRAVKALLEAGASPNERDPDGKPALILAIEEGSAGALESLLAHGADIEARDANGGTPLMAAAADTYSSELMKPLLAAGANVNARDFSGRTALMIAAANAPGREAAPGNMAQMLVKAGADVRARDNLGRTALHYAASYSESPEDPDVLLTMIKAGLSVNDRDSLGMTPLMDAARFTQQRGVITALLGAGANGALRSNEAKSAFAYASGNVALKYASPGEYEALEKARSGAAAAVPTPATSGILVPSNPIFLGSHYDQSMDTTVVASATSALPLANGGVILSGFTYLSGHTFEKAALYTSLAQFAARLDTSGKIVWQKTMPSIHGEWVGPSIVKGPRGSFYLLGAISPATGDTSSRDYAISAERYTEEGMLVWRKQLSQPEMGQYPVGTAGATASGDLLLASARSEGSISATTLWRISPDGAILWRRDFQGTPELFLALRSILELSDGSILLTGTEVAHNAECGLLVARLDATGALLWSRSLVHPDDPREGPSWTVGAAREANGSLFVCGTENGLLVLALVGFDGTLLRGASYANASLSFNSITIQDASNGRLTTFVSSTSREDSWKTTMTRIDFDQDLRFVGGARILSPFGLEPLSASPAAGIVIANATARRYDTLDEANEFGVLAFAMPADVRLSRYVPEELSRTDWPALREDGIQSLAETNAPTARLQESKSTWVPGSLVAYATSPWDASFAGLTWLRGHGLENVSRRGDSDIVFRLAETHVALHAAPRADSPIIATIDGIQALAAQNVGSMTDRVVDVDAPWYRVAYGNRVGWIFGAYAVEWH